MRPATPREREAYAMATKAPLLSSQPINRWSVWAAGYGGSAQVGGNAAVGSQDLTARVWGGAAGADYRISLDTLVGFSLGGGGLNYSLANAMGAGSADLFQAGVYGRHNFGPAYIAAALAYGWHDVTTNRTVALGRRRSAPGPLQGRHLLGPLRGRLSLHDAADRHHALCGRAGDELQPAQLFRSQPQWRRPVRAELRRAKHRQIPAPSSAPGPTRPCRSTPARCNGTLLPLRGRAAWVHDYTTAPRAHVDLPDAARRELRRERRRRSPADSALALGRRRAAHALNNVTLIGKFDGEFAGNVTSYSGKGVFKYSW